MAKKLNKFTKKAEELKAWGRLLEDAESYRRRCMENKTDDNGDVVCDEDGDWVKIAPSEDSYEYPEYCAWCDVIKALESLKV